MTDQTTDLSNHSTEQLLHQIQSDTLDRFVASLEHLGRSPGATEGAIFRMRHLAEHFRLLGGPCCERTLQLSQTLVHELLFRILTDDPLRESLELARIIESLNPADVL